MQRLFGAFQITDADADLAEGGERHAQSVRRSGLLLQLDTALDESQRLIVPMLHQRDIRLIPVDRCKDVGGLNHQGQTLGVAQSRHRFVQTALLREGNAGKRMHHREMAAIAGRVKRRSRTGDVLANDDRVAHLPVAEAKFVVGETDCAGVVRPFGLLQRSREEGNPPGRLAARNRDTPVHPPQIRQACRVEALPLVGRAAQGLGGLAKIVL